MSDSYVGIDKFVDALYPEAARERAVQNYDIVDKRLFRQQGNPIIIVNQAYWSETPGEYVRHDSNKNYIFAFAMEDRIALDLAKKCCILRVSTLINHNERKYFEDRSILLTERTPGRQPHVRNDLGYGLDRPLERRLSGHHLSEKRLAPYIGVHVGGVAIHELLEREKLSRDRRTYNQLTLGAKILGVELSN